MNCDWIKENVVLYIYDELADDARYEFEHHVRQCIACRQEVESAQAFKEAMASEPVREVSPSFLTDSRMKLQEALEEAEQSHGWGRVIFDFGTWFQQIKLAPAATAVLLMIGFFGGSLATWQLARYKTPTPADHSQPPIFSEANIAGVQSVVPQANSNKVTIKYDTLQPQTLEGALDDPSIQRLLLLGIQNNRNSGVRLDSVDLLTRRAEDNAVREALVYALRYDKNPGVRLRALDGLRSFVKDDVHVRDAVLEALMHDSNSGVRSEAISLLNPVRADMSVREALQVLAQHDQDKFIRAESKRYLESTPNLY